MNHVDILIFETGERGERKMKEYIDEKDYNMLLKFLLANMGKLMESKMRANTIRMQGQH